MINPEEIGIPERVVFILPWDDDTIDLFSLSLVDANRLRDQAKLEGISVEELLFKIISRAPRALDPKDCRSYVKDHGRPGHCPGADYQRSPKLNGKRIIRDELLLFGISGFLLLESIYDYLQ